MIKGIGVDIVDVRRIKEGIVSKVLSPEETELWNGFESVSRKQEFLAGRFAIKEAIKKALLEYEGFTGLDELVVLNDESGRPYLKSPQFKGRRILLSISHEREVAIGFCVVESEGL